MRHTESELERLLDERSRSAPPSPDLGAIVRRGRRIRRGRRAASAGAALAVAAVALMYGLPSAPSPAPVARQPTDTVSLQPELPLPETFRVKLGDKDFTLPLLHSERYETMGVPRTVTFSPTSKDTAHMVVCDDPRAWVVTRSSLKGGEMGGGAGRCGKGSGGHHDKLSAPEGWLERPQKMQIWVFPADAPIERVAGEVKACRPDMSEDVCARLREMSPLMFPEVLERLSAEVGERPGRWAVGIYDRAEEGE
ncbi:hypothetical protein AB0K18_18220 [Nonomuraea sp. NPDC049421]|uniref:hypothetical protein n=1 Tax=Nonomuraea sp. NPDC049421 TaxID=3155275 RepID=UPI00343D400A